MTGTPLFGRVAIVGIGLIGSSLAHVIRRENLAREIAVCDLSAENREKAMALRIADSVHADASEAADGADLVIISAPIGAFAAIGEALAPGAKR